jgi:RND family efflux transporter MFP subunit
MKRFLYIFIGIMASLSLVACSAKSASETDTDKTPSVRVTKLTKGKLEATIRIPGDLLAYESVDVFAKVSGFIQTINVDRGSFVKQGDVLATLVDPEIDKRIAQAKASYLAAQDQYQRASKLNVQFISTGQIQIYKGAADSAKENMESIIASKNFLMITAPFDGFITRRNLHPGALVFAGGTANAVPIFHVETIKRLRLVVPVPESQLDTVAVGKKINFTVPTYPDREFSGTLSRIAESLDPKTRTELVEFDVDNHDLALLPGMYADMEWPTTRPYATFLVSPKTLVTDTEKTFVVRVKNGVLDWVNVQRGNATAKQVEIFGDLKEGELLVDPASDELPTNTKVKISTD